MKSSFPCSPARWLKLPEVLLLSQFALLHCFSFGPSYISRLGSGPAERYPDPSDLLPVSLATVQNCSCTDTGGAILKTEENETVVPKI